MLYLLRGRANTGKSSAVLQCIAENGDRRPQILLVPDHASFAAEVDLCRACGASASRFGEVLTFRRLSQRVLETVGGLGDPVLDNGGKVLMMQRAIQDVSSVLTVYRRPSQKVAFLRSFIDLSEELQRYCIAPEDLMARAEDLEGDTANKFRDVALISAAYFSRISRDGINLTDYMDRLNRALAESNYSDEKDIYLDGFAHFTAQELETIRILLHRAHSVTVTLLGEENSRLDCFRAGNRAFDQLMELAERERSAVRVKELAGVVGKSALGHLEQHMFGKATAYRGEDLPLHIYEAKSLYSEVEYVAAQIRKLAASGKYRYREIGVAVRNLPDYAATVESVFERYEIPVYRSSRSDILEHPVMTLILSALDAVTGGYEYEDMFRYLKTGLSGISHEECDLLENYVIQWDIHGRRWIQEEDWGDNPDGYAQDWTDAQRARLKELNAIRCRVREPIFHLTQKLCSAEDAGGKMAGVYAFLEEIRLPQQLQEKTDWLQAQGELQMADEYRQLWELICCMMDQFVEILGDTPMDREEFVRLIKLVVSQYSVGTIPAALDQVGFSELSMNDRHQVKVLFLLGANDHVLPTAGGETGILSEEDRDVLLERGIRLAPHGMEKLALELQNIYAALVKPTEALWVTYPAADSKGTALRPAFVVERMCRLFPALKLEKEETNKAFHLTAVQPALEASGGTEGALRDFLEKRADCQRGLAAMDRARHMTRGSLSSEAVHALYGRSFRMSASRIDTVKSCHFAYFMQYGLRARERTPNGMDPAQIGTFLHYVMEQVTRTAVDLGGFAALSEKQLHTLVDDSMDEYIARTIGSMEGKEPRFRYLLRRLRRTIHTVMDNVAGELVDSDFVPISFELAFGENGDLPAITIQEAGETLSVSGKVDRVDGWLDGEKLYLRVIDYKTGKKSFDLADLCHGLNVQMLLYLFALEREGRTLYGRDILPAGVLYLPARDVILHMDRGATPEQLRKAVDKELRRSGLLLGDSRVLTAMEHTALEEPRYLPLSLDRSHNITRGIASAEQLGKLSRYVDRLLHQIARELGEGNIDADPCYRGEGDNACTYCEFASACHFVDGQDRDHLEYIRPVKPDTFWKMIDDSTEEETP